MWTWISIAIVLLFLIGGFREWFITRKYNRIGNQIETIDTIEINSTPDKPESFCYKIGWLAIETTDAAAVIAALPVSDPQPANWETGIQAAYKGRVFISPPMNSWVLVVSTNAMAIDHFVWQKLLAKLSKQFREAQGFGSFRIVDAYTWSKYRDGGEIRTYACSDWTSVIRGTLTPEEREYGKRFFDYSSPQAENEAYFEREDLVHPDEEDVLEIAKRWGFDPRELDSDKWPKSAGWICDLEQEYQLQTLARG